MLAEQCSSNAREGKKCPNFVSFFCLVWRNCPFLFSSVMSVPLWRCWSILAVDGRHDDTSCFSLLQQLVNIPKKLPLVHVMMKMMIKNVYLSIYFCFSLLQQLVNIPKKLPLVHVMMMIIINILLNILYSCSPLLQQIVNIPKKLPSVHLMMMMIKIFYWYSLFLFLFEKLE